MNETRQSWRGVERIVETDEHVFIYTSSVMAHVIPKLTATGDVPAFVEQAIQFWERSEV